MVLPSPLVFLPGLLSDHQVWSYQVSHLQDRIMCQVIPLFSGNNTEEMLDFVLNNIKGNFFLAGHSMGGWLALELARKAPERVLKLCLLNTSAQPDSEEKRQKRREMIQRVEQGEFETIAKRLCDQFTGTKKVKKSVLSMFLQVGKHVFLKQQITLLNRQDCRPFLSQLAVPTLVVHAREDKNFSLAVHQELTDNIPHAKLAIVEDSGHMSPMESPQAVTALLRFWLDYI